MRRRAWRIIQQRHAASAFDGEGASLYGGRWNRPGTPLIYCSQSLSLATLEILVNLDSGQALRSYVSIPVDFENEACQSIPNEDLPDDWAADPPSLSTQQYGSSWAVSLTSLILEVPSSVISSEANYLINPAHQDFTALVIGEPSPFVMDPRLQS